MKLHAERVEIGAAGDATEVLIDEHDEPDTQGTIVSWFLNCPGQSPAWRHFLLSVVHLRPIEGVRPATITVPGATHEVMLWALNPEATPDALNAASWAILRPVNMVIQVELPSDHHARELALLLARAIVHGYLPAEPPFPGGAVYLQPVLATAAHLRGEAHTHYGHLVIPKDGPDAPGD